MSTARLIAVPRPVLLLFCLVVSFFQDCPAASDPFPSPAPGAFRVLSWNVSQENLFKFADRYRAMFRIANPDLLLLDEIQGGRTQTEVAAVLSGVRGTNDTQWNILIGSAGGYQRPGIISRLPIEPIADLDGLRYPEADIAALKSMVPESKWTTRVQRSLEAGIPAVGAVVRLGDRTILAVAVDLQCCNDTNDWPEVRRQIEAREIRRALQQTLEKRRVDAVLIAGDLNLVGGNKPLETLTAPYPEPHRSLATANAVQLDGLELWTWDGRGSAFPSGRLDYSFYTPSSLQARRSVVLTTEDLNAEILSAHALNPGTSRELSDHLPVIVDYEWRISRRD
ncbi:MAG: endonuclease/exonuclease/phosphatase family protein [Verrucomicrobiales bacterium]|nr:endonuclease/exonuclease/phosphatase family protein [Verrucomicrobiales bacterium]